MVSNMFSNHYLEGVKIMFNMTNAMKNIVKEK